MPSHQCGPPAWRRGDIGGQLATLPAGPVHASPRGWLTGFSGPLPVSVLCGALHPTAGGLVSPEGLVSGRQVLWGGQKT